MPAFSDSGHELLLPLGELLHALQRHLGGELDALRGFEWNALDSLLSLRHSSPPSGSLQHERYTTQGKSYLPHRHRIVAEERKPLVELPGAPHDIGVRPSRLMAKAAYVLKWFEMHRQAP
jgi:hypothetical protein